MKNTVALLLLLISNYIFSQTINPEKLDHYFNYIEKNNLGVGSVSIFKNGKEIYSKNFGQKNIPGLTYDKNTRYQVGSVTKMITAVLIFRLIEENKLYLNSKLSEFYPEIVNADKITIKNLLEHTSGLGNYLVRNGEVWATEKTSDKEIMDLIITQGECYITKEKRQYGYFCLPILFGDQFIGRVDCKAHRKEKRLELIIYILKTIRSPLNSGLLLLQKP
ncbi:serine hydrolase [Chryseobacterium sp.]|uniref:serine hydrolase domain-containing protein n=1 Tax=Chryseobacterium sp. TaxID=1871047 RepID=UPI0035B4A3AA